MSFVALPRPLIVTGWMLACCSMPVQAFCYEEAGKRHGVHPKLLEAIARVESSQNPDAVNVNRQFKSLNEDIGLMQINSIWMPQLSRFGVTRDHLFNPCTNVQVGAWILAQQQQKFGRGWYAVGAYHSQTPELNKRYAQRVYTELRKMNAW
jgi:soluble lytic murein transglycosylase-like protein